MITKQEIEHLAKLSRLELSEEEKSRFQTELSSILDYVSKLQEIDTQNVEPISQITGLSNIQRKDKIEDFENKEGIFENAPQKQGDFFKVKTILGRKR